MTIVETSLALLGIAMLGRMSPGPDMMLLIRYAGLCSVRASGTKNASTTRNALLGETALPSKNASLGETALLGTRTPIFSSENLRQLRPAIACVAGICLGLAVHLSLVILGLAVVLQESPMLFTVISCLGSAYLIYIGIKSIKFANNFALKNCTKIAENVDQKSTMRNLHQEVKAAFLDGLFCNLLNPKVALFMLSLFSQFVAPDTAVHTKLFYGALVLGEASLGWLSFIFFLSTPFMQGIYAKYMLSIERVAGGLFIFLGLTILANNLL